jgi:undecaprenyl-diphosphatase
VGIAGLALEHVFRTLLGRPVPAAVFLIVNGFVLYLGERLRRRAPATDDPAATVVFGSPTEDTLVMAPVTGLGAARDADAAADARLARLSVGRATLIGSAQILALLAGISRSGVTMVAGLVTGLSHEDSARFAFLLATPAILGAGVLKVPDLFGPVGAGILGQVLAGSVASFVSAYVAVRYLTRYFQTRTLTPFAIYCVAAGAVGLLWLAVR